MPGMVFKKLRSKWKSMSNSNKKSTVISILLLMGLIAFIIKFIINIIAYINYPPMIAEDLTGDEKALLEQEFQITLPSDMDITKAFYDFEELKIRIKVESDESTRIVYEVLTRLIGLGDSDARGVDIRFNSNNNSVSSDWKPNYKNTDNEKVYSRGILNCNYGDYWDYSIETEFFYSKNGEIITEMVKDGSYLNNNNEVYDIFERRKESQEVKK